MSEPGFNRLMGLQDLKVQLNISLHIKNIFESDELEENSVSSIMEHTTDDGKKYKTIPVTSKCFPATFLALLL